MNARSAARFTGLALTMAAALAMSGCGGGSSTPSTPAISSILTPVPSRVSSPTRFYTFDSALTNAAQRHHVRAAVAAAAGNTPNSGSVTQSSTGDGAATDSVSVTVERDASGTVSYTVREAGGWSVDRDSARVLAESSKGIWKGIEYHQAPGGGQGSGTGPGLYVAGLYVDVYTDIEAPGTASDADSDYLAGGIWMRVPEDAASVADYEFGAFADGNDPFTQANLAGLTGTATYAGDATAVYSHQATNRNYFVDGDVSLTADFGDASSLGSISGTVSNFTGEGPESDWYEGVSVSLGDAQIGNADSGFFTGDTSTRSSDPTDPGLTGKWGGQFYGNGAAGGRPGSVAGTFGAATADGSESFVGAYGASSLAGPALGYRPVPAGPALGSRPVPPPAERAPAEPAPAASALPEPARPQSRDRSSTLFYTFDSALRNAVQRWGVRAAVAEAAGNTPNPYTLEADVSGGVTQSSTGDNQILSSVWRDEDGTLLLAASGWYGIDHRIVGRDSARVLAESSKGIWKGIEYHQAPGGGQGSGTGPGLYAYVYTDYEEPTSSCGLVGGILSRGALCTYELDGQTFTLSSTAFTINGVSSEAICFDDICGDNVNLEGWTVGTGEGVKVTIVTEGSSGGDRRIARISQNLADAAEREPSDADYLAGGIWMRVPEDAASVADYEFSAFADGLDPFTQANLEGLTGTATYAGDATAVYSHQATNRNYFVDGDVSLTADFGDASSLGSISGTVSNFTGEGPESDWYEGVSVSLGAASIGIANSGFFTGDTSTRSSDPTDPGLTGKWGGRFYGNGAAGDHPGSVAGTFGAATADGGESFVGVYGARRQQ